VVCQVHNIPESHIAWYHCAKLWRDCQWHLCMVLRSRNYSCGGGVVAFRRQSCRSSLAREIRLQFWTLCKFPSFQTTFYLSFQNTDSMAKSKLYLPTLIININTFVFCINKLQEGKMLADILLCTTNVFVI